MNPTELVTSVYDPTFDVWQVIDREPIQHDVERDLSTITHLSADDLGCTPGTIVRIDLRDDEDTTTGTTTLTAQ